jgi:hypothetical protein
MNVRDKAEREKKVAETLLVSSHRRTQRSQKCATGWVDHDRADPRIAREILEFWHGRDRFTDKGFTDSRPIVTAPCPT